MSFQPRRFGTKCGGCHQDILPTELVRRARDRVYHLKCFTCLACGKQLATGEELYMLDESRFLCKDDYLAKFRREYCPFGTGEAVGRMTDLRRG